MRSKPIMAILAIVSLMAAVFSTVVYAQPTAVQLTTDHRRPPAKPKTVVAVAKKPVEPAAKQPAENEVKVTVKPDDSLSSIAAAHDTTYVRIFDANAVIENPDIIHAGDELRIPAATEQLTNRPMPAAVAVAAVASAAAPAVRPAPVRTAEAGSAAAVPAGGVWDSLARCESGGKWAINTGNGFYGGLQFTLSSWQAVGGSGYPNQASRETQITMAERLQARGGWGNWPACAAKLGLR